MDSLPKIPFYAKASLFLIGLYVFISMLSITQDIVLPVIYATIIASLLSPSVDFLVQKKINRALAISGVLFIALLLLAILIALISSQASMLRESWPQLTLKFEELLTQSIDWVSATFNISTQKINTWITHSKDELISNSSTAIGITLTTMGGIMATALLTPVYIFMILFYQPHLVQFIHKLFGADSNININEILTETKRIIQSYLFGLFSEFAIIAILNSIGLLILGIEYAVLLGILGALLNVIPYIGGIITMALFMVIAMATKSPVYVLYVIGLYTLIQFIDNNYIVPKIVGSKVKLNALVSLVVVIAGAALWGIPGMILSIPLTAILKLILDRIESLKPWGFLLGDTMPPLLKLKIDLSNLSQKLPYLTSTFWGNSPREEVRDKRKNDLK